MITANYTDPQGKIHSLEVLVKDTVPGFVWGRTLDGKLLFRIWRSDLQNILLDGKPITKDTNESESATNAS